MSTRNSKKSIYDKADEMYPDVSIKLNREVLEHLPVVDGFDPISYNSYEVAGVPLHENDYKEKSSTTKYIIIGIVLLLILFIIIIIIYNYCSVTTDTTETSSYGDYEIDVNIGAIIRDKEYYKLASSLDKKMKKKFHFVPIADEKCGYGLYGDECQFQSHNPNYYNAGNFISTFQQENISGTHTLSLDYDLADGSKSSNSCTSICDNRADCKGLVFNHNSSTCSLITSDVVSTSDASMDYSTPVQMYLKTKVSPHFTNLVVGFSGSKPLRYYLNKQIENPYFLKKYKKKLRSGIMTFTTGHVEQLKWIPYRIVNHGGFVGIFSETKFSKEQWFEADLLYKDEGSGEYNLPTFLQDYSNIFVIYISKEIYNEKMN